MPKKTKTSSKRNAKARSSLARGSPARCWKDVPRLIDARPAESETVAHGISRSLCGNKLLVDFGNELGGIEMAEITFRDSEAAGAAYCKGIRLSLKVVEHPEHFLANGRDEGRAGNALPPKP